MVNNSDLQALADKNNLPKKSTEKVFQITFNVTLTFKATIVTKGIVYDYADYVEVNVSEPRYAMRNWRLVKATFPT